MADDDTPWAGIKVTLMDWDETKQEPKEHIVFETRFKDMDMLNENTKTIAITAGNATASGTISGPLGVIMDLIRLTVEADMKREQSSIIMPGKLFN